MSKIPESCVPVNARLQFEATVVEAEATLRRTMELRLTGLLIAIVCYVLGRKYHRRRTRVPRRLRRDGRCDGCESRASHRFTRNRFRERYLLTR